MEVGVDGELSLVPDREVDLVNRRASFGKFPKLEVEGRLGCVVCVECRTTVECMWVKLVEEEMSVKLAVVEMLVRLVVVEMMAKLAAAEMMASVEAVGTTESAEVVEMMVNVEVRCTVVTDRTAVKAHGQLEFLPATANQIVTEGSENLEMGVVLSTVVAVLGYRSFGADVDTQSVGAGTAPLDPGNARGTL